jgi:hypothetical protein
MSRVDGLEDRTVSFLSELLSHGDLIITGLIVNTGGGDDTVAFTPDARVGFALIDFGKKPGTKTWIPPSIIDFRSRALFFHVVGPAIAHRQQFGQRKFETR